MYQSFPLWFLPSLLCCKRFSLPPDGISIQPNFLWNDSFVSFPKSFRYGLFSISPDLVWAGDICTSSSGLISPVDAGQIPRALSLSFSGSREPSSYLVDLLREKNIAAFDWLIREFSIKRNPNEWVNWFLTVWQWHFHSTSTFHVGWLCLFVHCCIPSTYTMLCT